MNSLLFFKILLSPLLIGLSVLYGFFAFLYRVVRSFFSYKAKYPVISVGNYCVGGSGKTPLVIEISKHLKKRGFEPLVVCKSYKASLKSPCEVLRDSDPLVFGDEAVLMKEALGSVSVASGPIKYKVIKHFDKFSADKRVYVLDDGAQHHGIFKDIKIHVWDMTRSFVDLFPFPFGASREFWFLGEKPLLSVLNRFTKKSFISFFIRGEILRASYLVKSINSLLDGEPLKEDFVLISGLGNFKQLKNSVNNFIKSESFKMTDFIQGRDHDDFFWFKPSDGVVYVCTKKDKAKLEKKISPGFLYVVESDYNKLFKDELLESLDKIFEEWL